MGHVGARDEGVHRAGGVSETRAVAWRGLHVWHEVRLERGCTWGVGHVWGIGYAWGVSHV